MLEMRGGWPLGLGWLDWYVIGIVRGHGYRVVKGHI